MSTEAQFSIYKIDNHVFNTISSIAGKSGKEKADEIVSFMIMKIKESLSKKEKSMSWKVDKDEIKGVVYKTVNTPSWDSMVLTLVENTEDIEAELENTNVSYVLFFVVNTSIYAMTAGYGSHLIKDYIIKNWGLYLMPKLLSEEKGIIREVKENNLYGNHLSIIKANRNMTNLLSEKEMSVVFHELAVEFDEEALLKLGVVSENSKKKTTNVLLKDSLNVKRAISVEHLKKILEKIHTVEKEKDMYSMGYFIHARKLNIRNSDLLDQFVDLILENSAEDVTLIGDDYARYCCGADEYIVRDEKGDEYYTSESPITFADIIEQLKEDNTFSKTHLKKVLKKWTISTKSADGNQVLFPIPLFNSIQVSIEHKDRKIPCHLIQGEWFCLNDHFLYALSSEFKQIYDTTSDKVSELKKNYGLKTNKSMTEDAYNDSFFSSTNIIVAHKSLINNYEIADLIFWDDTTLYLMCNKSTFDGSGSRDLTNQMWAAATYYQNRVNSQKRQAFLEEYYEEILKRYTTLRKSFPIDKEVFISLFDKKICFVAGYMKSYSKSSNSEYAKFLTLDSYKKMEKMGYQYLVMGIIKED